MENINPNKKKITKEIIKFLSQKGFYLVMLLCIAVVTFTVVTVVNRNRQLNLSSNGNSNLFIEPDAENDMYLSREAQAREEDSAYDIQAPVMEDASSIFFNAGSEAGDALAEVDTGEVGHIIENEPGIWGENNGSAATITGNEANAVPAAAQPEKASPKPFNPAYPVIGTIIMDYAQDKLVFNRTLQEWTTHSGIDIRADRGTAVKAAEDGVISGIKNDPRYGVTIVIDHQNGFRTVYSNLSSESMVQLNETIKKGDILGAVGNTATFESGDEPHLHFEILKDNVPVNPLNYLPKR